MKITWKSIMTVKTPPGNSPNPSSRPNTPPQKTQPKGQDTMPKATQPKPQVPVAKPEPTPPTQPRPVAPPPIPENSTPNTMNSDGLFVIGTNHDICQDYVAHHNNGVKSYIVLADGCSGSPDSDVGARVLVKTHELYIPRMGVMDFNEYARRSDSIYTQIIEEAASNAKSLELDPMSLDATIMSIVSNKSGEFMITCYGDGVVALGRRDGGVEIYSVSYKEGYPNYLSYRLSKERSDRFNEKVSNYKEITLETIGPNGEYQKQVYKTSRVYDTYLGDKSAYRWVAVLSDGVQSFMRKVSDGTSVTQEPVPTHEVMEELFAFKNFQGTFVRRRVNRFLEACKERDWTHGDDLSVGVIYLGDDV